jgi:hypothetical protein
MIFTYPRGRWLLRAAGQDALLVATIGLTLGLGPGGPLSTILCLGCAAVLAWGITTIHFPSKVELTPDAVAFHGYGRSHTFSWADVERVRVRRFLVRDRVLVRISPTTAFRGRYWLTDALSDYDALVHELERRQS